MPEQVHCPSCKAALRVPENLLGKTVKCPKCQTTFVAEIDEPAEPERITREPRPAAKRRPRPPEDIEEEEELLEEEQLEEEPEEEYEERPRRKRGRRRLSEAKALISGPATSILVVGIIDIVLGVLGLLLYIGLGFLMKNAGPGGGAQGQVMINTTSGILLSIGTIIFGSVITLGAVRMKQLRSYGLAMTACFLAMVPAVNCCLLGLPFGIWALTVLNKPQVKDSFS